MDLFNAKFEPLGDAAFRYYDIPMFWGAELAMVLPLPGF